MNESALHAFSKGSMNMELSSKAFVIHDTSGEIISVGRVPTGVKGKVEVRTDVEGHSVVEVELDAHQAAMSLPDLHKNHKVHVASKKLVRK
jgi:hypothetical protein